MDMKIAIFAIAIKILVKNLPKTRLGNNGSSTFPTNSVKDLLPYVNGKCINNLNFYNKAPTVPQKVGTNISTDINAYASKTCRFLSAFTC